MSSNSSRYSHQRGKSYTQVNLVQGAMVTDSDQTESQVLANRTTALLGDTSIRTGVPKTGGVLVYETSGGPADTIRVKALKPGKMVADGHVGHVDVRSGETLASPAGLDLMEKQADLLVGREPSTDGRTYCVYGDLWQRHVGVAEDSRLVDSAFLSAETSTRKVQMAQLKHALVANDVDEHAACGLIEEGDIGLPPYGDLRLIDVEFESEIIAPDECDPCATELTDANLDAGNHLFRFEIHESAFNQPELTEEGAHPQDLGQKITVKFSRDNGSVEVPASQAELLLNDATYANSVFELTDLRGEQLLGVYPTDHTNRNATLFNRDGLETALGGNVDGMIVRVWDGAVELDLSQNELAPNPIGLQSAQGDITKAGSEWTLNIATGGLVMQFVCKVRDNGQPFILPGDAFAVEIREYASDDGEKLNWQSEPVEVEHHYVYLGKVRGGEFVNETRPDLRSRSFPALTEIDGEDVAWSNHHHTDVDANTVQGAIDLLFDRETGEDCQCTFCIRPDESLTEQLKEIAGQLEQTEGAGSALICFPAGYWELEAPVAFNSARSITMRGVGAAASVVRIVTESDDEAFLVADCDGFAVEDLGFANEDKTKSTITVKEAALVRVLRCAFSLKNDVNLAKVGLEVFGPTQGIQHTALHVHDSFFPMSIACFGLVAAGRTRTIVENCSFASAQAQLGSVGGKLSAASEYVAATKVVKKTAAREREIASGRYAEMPGNAGLLIDMTTVPEEGRDDLIRYWEHAVTSLKLEGEIATEIQFEAAREKLGQANTLVGLLAEKELTQARSLSAEAPGVTAGQPRFRVLSALSGVPDNTADFVREVDRTGGFNTGDLTGGRTSATPPARLRTSGATDARTGAAEGRRAAAAATTAESLALRPSGVSERDEERIRELLQKVGEEDRVADYAEGLGNFKATPIVAPTPSVGIFTLASREIDTQIHSNRFFGLDVAISLAAEGDSLSPDSLQVPGATTVRDNVIARPIKTAELQPGEQTLVPKHCISCNNIDNLTIENNTINHTPHSSIKNASYYAQLLDYTMDRDRMHFTAISIKGRIGPKLRVIGNAAHNFRHCVYVSADLVKENSQEAEEYRQNFWIFRENSVFPNGRTFDNHDIQSNWAVALDPAQLQKIDDMVRLGEAFNHPPRPGGA